jgi:hypothetical protein
MLESMFKGISQVGDTPSAGATPFAISMENRFSFGLFLRYVIRDFY